MPSTTLKGVPDKLLRHLRKRAKEFRRSLNAEILFRLEESVRGEPVDPEEFIRRRDAWMKSWGYSGPRAGEIEAAIKGRL